MPTGVCGGHRASNLQGVSNLQESWSKGSQVARGLATVFPVTFFFSTNLVTIVGQLVSWSECSPPPTEDVLAHHCCRGVELVGGWMFF